MTYKYWDQQRPPCPTSSPLVHGGKYDVLLRGCYLYKDLPFLRVTFIDVEKSRRVVSEGIVREQEVIDKRTELLRCDHVNNCTTHQPRLLTAYVTQSVSSDNSCVHFLISNCNVYDALVLPPTSLSSKSAFTNSCLMC